MMTLEGGSVVVSGLDHVSLYPSARCPPPITPVDLDEQLLLQEIAAMAPDEQEALLAAMDADPHALARLVLHTRQTNDLVGDLRDRELRVHAWR
jgi:hypothetical protein